MSEALLVKEILAKTNNFDRPKIDSPKEMGLSYLIECFVCEKEALADRGIRPDGWRVVKDYGYTLCPECANKLKNWIKRGER